MAITFRSDNESDFACLEQYLTGGAFGELPHAWRHQAEHDLAFLQTKIDEVAAQMSWVTPDLRQSLGRVADIALPTRYDSPLQYRIVDSLVARIRHAAEKLELEEQNFPHYACIPTGLVNASAVALPCATRPFLLFDSELFLYCHLFAKSFAECLPIVGRGERLSISVVSELVEERIRSSPELVGRFANLLIAYASTGSPSKSRQHHAEPDYLPLITILRNGMELFVVGHELGHVYSGHLGSVFDRLHINSDDLLGDNAAHRQEHEADIVGLLLTLQAMVDAGYDAGLSYIGVELFFVSLEIAERARLTLDCGDDDSYVDEASVSHPSNGQRRIVTDAFLETFICSEEDVQGARALAANYSEVAMLLWQHARLAHFRAPGCA
jgi:hypothetical protein